MSTLTSEERSYWENEQQRAIEEATKPTPEELAALAHRRDLKREIRLVRQTCPLLWSELTEGGRPLAHVVKREPPSLPFSAGEHMAYALGQDSVGNWMLRLVDQPDEEEPSND